MAICFLLWDYHVAKAPRNDGLLFTSEFSLLTLAFTLWPLVFHFLIWTSFQDDGFFFCHYETFDKKLWQSVSYYEITTSRKLLVLTVYFLLLNSHFSLLPLHFSLHTLAFSFSLFNLKFISGWRFLFFVIAKLLIKSCGNLFLIMRLPRRESSS